MNKYLALDTETGGLLPENSLLTAYFEILDENFNMVDSLSLTIKPLDGIYKLCAGGMAVNNINIIEHDKVAITEKEAGTLLYQFLNKNKSDEVLIPFGSGVIGDINKLKSSIISSGSLEKFISHRVLDTGIIARYLQLVGNLSNDIGTGLHALRDYFSIKISGVDHSADVDVKISIEVLKKLIELGK